MARSDDVFQNSLVNLLKQGDPRAFDFLVRQRWDIKDVLRKRQPIRTDRFLKGFFKALKRYPQVFKGASKALMRTRGNAKTNLSRGASQDIQRSLFEGLTENSQGT